MTRLTLCATVGLLHVQVATAFFYRIFVSTGFSGIDDDKVSIILVGEGGAQTAVHDLPGPFDRLSVMRFKIYDQDVGKLAAIKIRLVQIGLYQDFWILSQIFVVTSSRKRFLFPFNAEVKHQWNTISLNCRKGLKKTSDGKCVDIDECKTGGGCVDKVATCHNTIGSYTCSCPVGYRATYDNRCRDVDECGINNGGCDKYCINTIGSYHCACHRSGFQVVEGYRCEDIDECKEGKDNCDKRTTVCSNYPGHFSCRCKLGYVWKDYSSCQRRKCSSRSVFNGKLEPARCSQTEQNKYEDKCKVVCNHGYVLSKPSAETTTCGPDGNWVPLPSTCTGRPCPALKDIPNGKLTADSCKIYLSSTNRYGGRCTYRCNSGYDLKGDSYRDCQADGTWSRAEPICEKVYPSYKEVNTSLPCDVGSIRNSSLGFTGCYECPPGTYDKSGVCEACAEGTFQDKTAQTDCTACPEGTTSEKGAYSCRPICPPGRYSKDGLGPSCDFCSNGTYQDKPQQTSCQACPKGTYTLHIGATFCGRAPQITKLEPGEVASVNAEETVVLKCSSEGEPTPSVYWQFSANGKGSKIQQPIKDKDGNPRGTQLTITNADASDSGSYTCTSANTHGDVTRSVQLTVTKLSVKRTTTRNDDLAKDEFVPRAKDQCPAGLFSSDGLGPLCRTCPKDTYQDQPGKTACKNCEHGTKTLQLAATSAEACGVAPVIISVNSSVNASGNEAVLDCYAHASPPPLVKWRFMEDVPSDFLGIPKLVQLVDDKGVPTGTRMIIRALTKHNTGRYECTAVNQFGRDKRTLELNVR